jgi:GTPase Era involved in 16S rRNA processing
MKFFVSEMIREKIYRIVWGGNSLPYSRVGEFI